MVGVELLKDDASGGRFRAGLYCHLVAIASHSALGRREVYPERE